MPGSTAALMSSLAARSTLSVVGYGCQLGSARLCSRVDFSASCAESYGLTALLLAHMDS
jgi:hypothetical protein